MIQSRRFLAICCVGCLVNPAAAQSPQDVSEAVDLLFTQSWQADGLAPISQTDDSTFLRRVTLDLTGVLPSLGEVRTFLADQRPDKRSQLIEELLTRPQHARHLANIWRDVLLPNSVPEQAGTGLENWLHGRFRENIPYDELVREILLAQGGLTQAPPVIYYAALDTKPEQLAASVSSVFLGVQIRCAECHDHPFTNWKQEDFWSQAAFFARVQGPSREGGITEVQEVSTGEAHLPTTMATVAPRFLDNTPVTRSANDPRRVQLARWITDEANPYFARATVNRVWHVMFGRGLVDPVDDQGDHNPPTHPEVLDLLATDFVNNDFNLRRVFQVLAETDLYQIASSRAAGGDDDPLRTYTSMPVRSLTAKQTYDCLLQAARRREPLDPTEDRLIQERIAFLLQIEAPTQQATEFQGGIPQALTLLNGEFVSRLTDPATSDFIVALADNPFLTNEQRVENLFLATVSRMPSEVELERSLNWLMSHTKSGDRAQALSDILWALLNSSEFVLIQ